jgi:hypothetical protein
MVVTYVMMMPLLMIMCTLMLRIIKYLFDIFDDANYFAGLARHCLLPQEAFCLRGFGHSHGVC